MRRFSMDTLCSDFRVHTFGCRAVRTSFQVCLFKPENENEDTNDKADIGRFKDVERWKTPTQKKRHKRQADRTEDRIYYYLQHSPPLRATANAK